MMVIFSSVARLGKRLEFLGTVSGSLVTEDEISFLMMRFEFIFACLKIKWITWIEILYFDAIN